MARNLPRVLPDSRGDSDIEDHSRPEKERTHPDGSGWFEMDRSIEYEPPRRWRSLRMKNSEDRSMQRVGMVRSRTRGLPPTDIRRRAGGDGARGGRREVGLLQLGWMSGVAYAAAWVVMRLVR